MASPVRSINSGASAAARLRRGGIVKRILYERQCKINNQGRCKLLKIRDIETKSKSTVEHLYPLLFPCRFYDEQLVKSLGASKCKYSYIARSCDQRASAKAKRCTNK